ncbi:MAG: GNAT family N-acetyltransferase [Promethearchaeota archaeon]
MDEVVKRGGKRDYVVKLAIQSVLKNSGDRITLDLLFNLMKRDQLCNLYIINLNTKTCKIVDEEAYKKGLQGSLYCVCAELNGEIIGMVRVIGDSGLYFYIQDVIVLPQYQKRGIGMLLMKKVMNFLDNNISTLTVVGLMASKGKEPFYEKFGFTKRPS